VPDRRALKIKSPLHVNYLWNYNRRRAPPIDRSLKAIDTGTARADRSSVTRIPPTWSNDLRRVHLIAENYWNSKARRVHCECPCEQALALMDTTRWRCCIWRLAVA